MQWFKKALDMKDVKNFIEKPELGAQPKTPEQIEEEKQVLPEAPKGPLHLGAKYVDLGLKGKLLVAADALPNVKTPEVTVEKGADSAEYKDPGTVEKLKTPGATINPPTIKPDIKVEKGADSATYKDPGKVEKLEKNPKGTEPADQQPESDVKADAPQFKAESSIVWRKKADASPVEQTELGTLVAKEEKAKTGGPALTPEEVIKKTELAKK